MDSLNGWETLEEIDGTPLVRTGHADPGERKALVRLLSRYCPDWPVGEAHQQ
ncbi:hypothetical protein [Nocardiopsis akebiae]|uniref:hypothetical protein n=1 Tax=Nocardiopsis akebiae TaxID=2831968 RepID=UPI002016071E|nr:hypothetical protein [Nocardiopsis akebiae]